MTQGEIVDVIIEDSDEPVLYEQWRWRKNPKGRVGTCDIVLIAGRRGGKAIASEIRSSDIEKWRMNSLAKIPVDLGYHEILVSNNGDTGVITISISQIVEIDYRSVDGVEIVQFEMDQIFHHEGYLNDGWEEMLPKKFKKAANAAVERSTKNQYHGVCFCRKG